MRIAMIVNRFPLISETFVLNQIAGLRDAGHTVDIFTFHRNMIHEDQLHGDIPKYNLLDHLYVFPEPMAFRKNVLKSLVFTILNSYKNPIKILSALNIFQYGSGEGRIEAGLRSSVFWNKKSYDIVHCQFGNVAVDMLPILKFSMLGKKWVVSFRGYDLSAYVQKHGDHIFDPVFKYFDQVLAVSNYYQSQLIKLGCPAEKISVHHSGIDLKKFPFRQKREDLESKIQILTYGRLVSKKGLQYAIRAVADVAGVHPNVHYTIIGEGECKNDLHSLIQDLNMTHHIQILEPLAQEKLCEWLHRSDIFLAPSVTAANGDQEGIPNSLKEAMAVGLPVVSTLHSGIPELIEDGVSGFLVEEKNSAALAERITQLIERPELRVDMGRQGRSKIEKEFDQMKLNVELERLYRLL